MLAAIPVAEPNIVPAAKTKVVRKTTPVVNASPEVKTEDPRPKPRPKLTEEDVMKNLRGGE